jgi:glucose/arabinose dehydrogenase
MSRLGTAVLALLCTIVALAVEPPLATVQIINSLGRLVYVTAPPGDTSRIFVLQQVYNSDGLIHIYNLKSKTLNPTPFLTIHNVGIGSEQGVLCLAFDPNYAVSGYFYVSYVDAAGTSVLARYSASADPNSADPNSAYPIISIPQPYANHNGGWIGFGPDGYLYYALGDGGSQYDPDNRAQNLLQPYGKILRLDINRDDFPADPNLNYGIPADNPFANNPSALPEIWAYGLRNPWRPSFDRLTGDLWIADVGQKTLEEIDFQPAGTPGGRNYGWRCMEGTLCTGMTGCDCNDPALTLPIYTYPHTSSNCSITGGYVYRGTKICGLEGAYFFADYCTARIWTFRYNGSTITDLTDRTAELGGLGNPITHITSFGEDASGELYLTSLDDNVYRIVQAGPQRGDLNNDGVVDFRDINPFVRALADPVGYTAQYGYPPERAGDMNCDGVVDFKDINPFVALLSAM